MDRINKYSLLQLWGYAAALGVVFVAPCVAKAETAVVAIKENTATSISADTILNSGPEGVVFVSKNKVRIEMAPYAVGSFEKDGSFRLLRGSAQLESNTGSMAHTSSTQVEFIGKVILSYDHKEKSTSAFVTSGEARILNPHRSENSLRLDRWKGATMVLGDVYPSLVRELSPQGLDSWLKGYAWSEEKRKGVIASFPGQSNSPEALAAKNSDSKERLEDYFAAIDRNEDRPDYYERKFADPDKAIAEASVEKSKDKGLAPEEAAMISLPKTGIDLDMGIPMEIVSMKKRQEEILNRPDGTENVAAPKVERASRGLASVGKPKNIRQATSSGDPEVEAALARLKNLRKGSVEGELRSTGAGRMPASFPAVNRGSETSLVADPVYDFSENF